jgi:predicted nucleotidyltransferase
MIARQLTPADRAALLAFTERVTAEADDGAYAIVLFGSKARGDATPESDVDVLVLGESDAQEIKRRFWGWAFDLLLEYGVYLSVRAMSVTHWRELAERRPQLYANLVHDGIVLYQRPGIELPEFRTIDLEEQVTPARFS